MSLDEVERFSKDLKSDPALLVEASKNPLQAVVDVAVKRGYSFTFAEAKTFIRSRAPLPGRELSESELDKVTGGVDLHSESIRWFL